MLLLFFFLLNSPHNLKLYFQRNYIVYHIISKVINSMEWVFSNALNTKSDERTSGRTIVSVIPPRYCQMYTSYNKRYIEKVQINQMFIHPLLYLDFIIEYYNRYLSYTYI